MARSLTCNAVSSDDMQQQAQGSGNAVSGTRPRQQRRRRNRFGSVRSEEEELVREGYILPRVFYNSRRRRARTPPEVRVSPAREPDLILPSLEEVGFAAIGFPNLIGCASSTREDTQLTAESSDLARISADEEESQPRRVRFLREEPCPTAPVIAMTTTSENPSQEQPLLLCPPVYGKVPRFINTNSEFTQADPSMPMWQYKDTQVTSKVKLGCTTAQKQANFLRRVKQRRLRRALELMNQAADLSGSDTDCSEMRAEYQSRARSLQQSANNFELGQSVSSGEESEQRATSAKIRMSHRASGTSLAQFLDLQSEINRTEVTAPRTSEDRVETEGNPCTRPGRKCTAIIGLDSASSGVEDTCIANVEVVNRYAPLAVEDVSEEELEEGIQMKVGSPLWNARYQPKRERGTPYTHGNTLPRRKDATRGPWATMRAKPGNAVAKHTPYAMPKPEPVETARLYDIGERQRRRKLLNGARDRYMDQYKSKSSRQYINNLVDPEKEKATFFQAEPVTVKLPKVSIKPCIPLLECDAHLRALLLDEASFLPRVPTLFRQLKIKAKQILAKYDLSAYTADEVRKMKTAAIGAAMVPSDEELNVMHILNSARVHHVVEQFNSFLESKPYGLGKVVAAKVKTALKLK
ncbi:MAG: hypothetical protein FuTV2_gp1 [Hangzhou tombus-like virus 2]|nr:MAG: hypothetical protein FuTV2_gp1 [Hangzhou tombus-like virus 2]